MLGLLVLFIIGKWHYTLAETHKRSRWLFGILGVVGYYVGVYIGALLIGMLAVVFEWDSIFELSDTVYHFISMPFGILATWGLHTILRKNWEKNPTTNSNLLDDEILE